MSLISSNFGFKSFKYCNFPVTRLGYLWRIHQSWLIKNEYQLQKVPFYPYFSSDNKNVGRLMQRKRLSLGAELGKNWLKGLETRELNNTELYFRKLLPSAIEFSWILFTKTWQIWV